MKINVGLNGKNKIEIYNRGHSSSGLLCPFLYYNIVEGDEDVIQRKSRKFKNKRIET